MKLAIMQPYYFPYIGYWQLIAAVEKFIIYDDVNFIRGGWINRNLILVNDSVTYITIPVCHASSYKRINELSIHSNDHWKKKQLKTIKQAYQRAPYFETTFQLIESIILYDANNLVDYLCHQLRIMAESLGITTELALCSDAHDNRHLKGQDRVLDICRREGAEIYINAIGGQALYSREVFANNSLDLKFLAPYDAYTKEAGKPSRLTSLSIIDLMMFRSPDEIKSLLNRYELV